MCIVSIEYAQAVTSNLTNMDTTNLLCTSMDHSCGSDFCANARPFWRRTLYAVTHTTNLFLAYTLSEHSFGESECTRLECIDDKKNVVVDNCIVALFYTYWHLGVPIQFHYRMQSLKCLTPFCGSEIIWSVQVAPYGILSGGWWAIAFYRKDPAKYTVFDLCN